ncbi:DedA family protein [Rubrobacter taiwanensis]|jgi:membrane-associated protein|uniref:DedA family protein n=1 Tax=Rubrobacter taiwanensis TaxID=185139 RepID=A0A4R1BI27_9ACTN|nr:DedA family protein [Rubrobacter taiwanensis]TCJ16884.1 DedA family protein [Rubrobacter taiwanensis]
MEQLIQQIVAIIRSIPDSPRGLLEFITYLFLEHGYLVVFVGTSLDNFGLPASGDIVMLAGGWLANTERAELWLVMLVGGLGGAFSDSAMYWIGRIGGRTLIERLSKTRILSRIFDLRHLGRVERYFAEHGGKTLLLARFGAGLRSATPLFAGVSGMRYTYFLPFNLLAVTVWALTIPTAGYFFGQYWSDLVEAARSAGFVFVALVLLLAGLYVYRRYRVKRSRR